MTSPYADLRARLAPLVEELRAGAVNPDWLGLRTLERAADAIDALLDRGEAAEADADRLRGAIRYALAWFDSETLAEFRRDASGGSIHDEAVALRKSPS